MKARLQSTGNYRRILVLAILASFGVVFALGCESRGGDGAKKSGGTENLVKKEASEGESVKDSGKQPESEVVEPEVVFEKGAMPTAETVLARGKGVEITLGDYELAMHRSLLFAPPKADGSPHLEVPVVRTASPEIQSVLIEHLFETRAVREEAEKRGIACSDKAVVAQLASRKTLEKYAVLFSASAADPEKLAECMADLEALKLTKEDVRALACEEVLNKKVQNALLAEISDAELWTAYQHARDRVDLVVASVSNTPSSAELNAFLEADQARENPQIDAHFARYPERYMLPRLALVTTLSAPSGQDGPDVEDKLQRAANRLSSGEAPKAIASGLGLVLKTGDEVHAGESPKAFAAEVGGTGFEIAGPRGAYAWRLEGFREAEPLELTRPLRREIAAELLRESGVLDSAKEKLQPALEAMKSAGALKKDGLSEEQIDALRAELAADGVRVIRTSAFAKAPQGFVPGVGLAQEVTDAAFELTEKKPTYEQPVLSRDRVFVFRLVNRHHPTRSGFKKDKESFRRSYVEGRRDQVISSMTAAKYADADIVVDMQPLRIKYGTIEKAKK